MFYIFGPLCVLLLYSKGSEFYKESAGPQRFLFSVPLLIKRKAFTIPRSTPKSKKSKQLRFAVFIYF